MDKHCPGWVRITSQYYCSLDGVERGSRFHHTTRMTEGSEFVLQKQNQLIVSQEDPAKLRKEASQIADIIGGPHARPMEVSTDEMDVDEGHRESPSTGRSTGDRLQARWEQGVPVSDTVRRVMRVPTEPHLYAGHSGSLIADGDQSPPIVHQILDELKELGTYQKIYHDAALQALQSMEERVNFLELRSRVASAEGLLEDIALVLICFFSMTVFLYIVSVTAYIPRSGCPF
ncbi:hypothetical protein PQX77_008164 [Marasmius sp. AFHP31]|nr:hypothetical protein PQX77_008164 [Marasmius sp. AFHP31]